MLESQVLDLTVVLTHKGFNLNNILFFTLIRKLLDLSFLLFNLRIKSGFKHRFFFFNLSLYFSSRFDILSLHLLNLQLI